MKEKKRNEFYIGWQEKAPEVFASKSRKFIWMLVALVPAVALLLVLSQRDFAGAVFEFGKLTTMEGLLVRAPVPMLKASAGGSVKSILLVGFGKIGAENDLAAMEAEEGPLEGKHIRLRGMLIYDDGKTVFELTEGPPAFAGFGSEAAGSEIQKQDFGYVTMRGEILDPKCALGVMKPGYGKPHRSCAIRCISGGIPPVLRVENAAGEKNYCLLLSENGKQINKKVLDFVADQVQICGRLEQLDDWLVLYTNPEEDILRLQPHWMAEELPMCAER